jgi:hypothetical protein
VGSLIIHSDNSIASYSRINALEFARCLQKHQPQLKCVLINACSSVLAGHLLKSFVPITVRKSLICFHILTTGEIFVCCFCRFALMEDSVMWRAVIFPRDSTLRVLRESNSTSPLPNARIILT